MGAFVDQDFVLNGNPMGEVADAVVGQERYTMSKFDPGLLRPYYVHDGFSRKPIRCVTINAGPKKWCAEKKKFVQPKIQVPVQKLKEKFDIDVPVHNATALRKEEWLRLEDTVIAAARKRLKAWEALAKANTLGGFDGMSTTILEHETISDTGSVSQDMDGLGDGSNNDAPLYQLEGIPLPITHSSFAMPRRLLNTSRVRGQGLDVTQAEIASRRVAEHIEKTTIGVVTGITYGGNSTQIGGYGRTSAVYGYTNFPDRLTYASIPTPTGNNQSAIYDAVLEMLDLLYDANHYGPFMLYHSTDFTKYMNADYGKTSGTDYGFAPSLSLRERIKQHEDIVDVQRLDYMTPTLLNSTFNMVLVDLSNPNVARAINGLDLTTVQWESSGGMKLMFKVMCIYVPQLRADYNGNTGICHGTPA